MKRLSTLVLFCVVLVLGIVVDSFAEVSSDELLQILKEKGLVTEQDIERAKEFPKEEGAASKKEVVMNAARSPKSVNFKGRVQARFTSIENGDLESVTSQNAFDKSEFDGFVIRRVRLQFFGKVHDRWKYHVQVSADGDHNADRADPETADYGLRKDEVGLKLQDGYFTYDRDEDFTVVVGQFKSRFSPSYLTSGPFLPLCERPLAIDKLSRKREVGISIESRKKGQFDGRGYGVKTYDRKIFYAVGLYNGNGYNRNRNDNENLMATSMLVMRPNQHFNFGFSYAYDHVGYDSETTVLGSAMVDTSGNYVFGVKDGMVGKRINLLDVNSALDAGSLHIQVEYIQQTGHRLDRGYGYGVQGQVDMTDTFQIAVRYDEFDPNVDVDNSLDSRWYTLGTNWFVHGQNIKCQLNYTHREEVHGGQINNDIVITHFQVLF
jgi:phosphate-selective porin